MFLRIDGLGERFGIFRRGRIEEYASLGLDRVTGENVTLKLNGVGDETCTLSERGIIGA